MSEQVSIKGDNSLHGYMKTENGFAIKLDLRLYDRAAFVKAFYRFHSQYIISYDVNNPYVDVYFEPIHPINDMNNEVASILRELDFQMIRVDTIRQTKGIRELLVARSLYATCIEQEKSIADPVASDNDYEDWREDQDKIFASWSEEMS